MKTYINLIVSGFIILFSTQANSQILDGNLEDYDSGCGQSPTWMGSTPNSDIQIHEGCSNGGWFVSHGTPQIAFESGGNKSIYMWAGQWPDQPSFTGGEGVYQRCLDFLEGKSYTINFRLKMRTGTLTGIASVMEKFKIVLTNDLVHSGDDGTAVPLGLHYLTPNVSGQLIAQVENISDTNWFNYSFSFIPDDNYTRIWFYPEQTNLMVSVFLDDVSFSCETNEVYTNNSNLPQVTGVSDFISASTNVNVLPGQDVIFTAGNYIDIQSGFYAMEGSAFCAIIEGCESPFPFCFPSGLGGSGMIGQSVRSYSGSVESSEMEKFGLQLYPNPNNGQFTIQLTDIDPKEVKLVEVYDVTGKSIFKQGAIQSTTLNIDISNQRKGMYIVRVVTENQSFTERIFKQ
jgi:hypothetical protein